MRVEKVSYRRCAAPKVGNPRARCPIEFPTTRDDRLYCSDVCSRRAAYHRQKKELGYRPGRDAERLRRKEKRLARLAGLERHAQH